MDVVKIRSVLDNLKMDPNYHVNDFAAKMNSNFSQQWEFIPRGQIVPADRTIGIHKNATKHTHLQYLKYCFIAQLTTAILKLAATKDLATFSKVIKEAIKNQELTK